jgi:MSHA biogenesis protein MshI
VLELFGRKKRVEGLIGLSVNDSRISLAQVTRRRDELMLEKCLRQSLDKPGAMRETLMRLVDEHGLAQTACSYVLSPSDYNVYLVEAPQVEDDEIREAVRWKIKDLLDMPVEDAVIDVFPVPEGAFQGRNKMLYAVAASRPQIEQLIASVDRAGLTLHAIDIPEMAMRNISNLFLDDRNGLAFISLKQSGSTLNITRNGELYLTRRINTPIGADALMQNDWEMLRDRLALEIQRSLDYFESQMGQPPVAQIMIAPRERDTESMMNALADALAAPVGMVDFVHEMPAREDIAVDVKGACMMSIGAALRTDLAGGSL